jgi:beta-lactamase class A
VKETIKRYWWRALIVVVLLAGAGVLGSLITQWQQHRATTVKQEKYSFLSKRILNDQPNDVLLNFRPLQNSYETYLANNNLQDKVDIYFEYLPTGSSIGINEDRQTTGASLLKLPLAISFYKLVEQGKLSLDTTVALKKEWLNSSFGSLYQKGEGYQLSYRDALKYALRDSDNTAALALFDAVSKVEMTDSPSILSFVDANYSQTPQKEVTISPQSYASILKCLFFSCYLNKDDSQAVLNELAHSDANYRLPLYLPENVRIAHKIGTFQNLNQSDCGIVYIPKRQYLICIMVQGRDPEASRVIGDLSQITYDFVKPEEKSAADQ